MTEEEFEAVKPLYQPVDSRETGMEKPETLVTIFEEPADVKILTDFADMAEADLKELYGSPGLAMTFKDFLHIQNYYKTAEQGTRHMTETACWILTGPITAVTRHFHRTEECAVWRRGLQRPRLKIHTNSIWRTHSEIFTGKRRQVCLP